MTPAKSFVEGLLVLWRARNAAEAAGVDIAARDRWVQGLTCCGHQLLETKRNPPELQRFRERVMADRHAFEARVSERVDARLQDLGDRGRHWLALFETEPDLLGPFDFLRAETVHTRVIAWALRGASQRPDGLGREPLRAFLTLLCERGCGFAEEALGRNLDGVQVTAERSVPPFGRVDLWLVFPDFGDMAVEVKVDHVEREQQVADYREAISDYGCTESKHGATVFLTVHGDVSSDDGATPVRFEDLLRVWIPVAGHGKSGEHGYLRRYLKSVATGLCGLGGEGRFDEWHWTRRARTLDFIGSAG